VNCWVDPFGTETFAGVTARETSAGGATVRAVVPVIEPDVAEIVLVPCATVLANPVVGSMVATLPAEDTQVTAVRFCWLPSV
jgi:hypothetical protein